MAGLLLGLASGCHDDGTGVLPPAHAWVKFPSNPVLQPGPPGSWDELGVGTPCVVRHGPDSLRLWYSGRDADASRIGLATSSDGITWTKHAGNPVFAPGEAGAWDGLGVQDPCVVEAGGTWRLYYAGRGAGRTCIGLATSSDGVHWTRADANPVLVPNTPGTSWEGADIFTPWVRRIGSRYGLWYASNGSTGYAASSDGLAWTKRTIPVLQPLVLEALTFAPCVLPAGSGFRMWYAARHELAAGGFRPADLDYAQSADGVEWTWIRTILGPGEAGAWDTDGLRAVSVLDEAGGTRLWFEGRAAGGASAIGLATFE